MSEYIVDFGTSTYKSNDGLIFAPVEQLHEEIVRCRYCKYYDRMNDDEGMCMVPDDNGDYARWMVDDVGYCYLGERRDE